VTLPHTEEEGEERRKRGSFLHHFSILTPHQVPFSHGGLNREEPMDMKGKEGRGKNPQWAQKFRLKSLGE